MMHRESIDFGGRTLTLEVGRLAKQAHGGVWVEYGDSRVLVTACYNENSLPTGDFFPLTVDYQEKMSAVGRFPGGYIKREGRPQLRETLTSRLIDRPIRPLFSEGYRRETQIIATVFSADKENDPAIMALIGASAALTVSCIPFEGPVAGVRIALIDGAFVCNPTNEQLESARLDLIVVASEKAIVMVEGECDEVSEAEMVDALMQAFDWAQPVIEAQKRLAAAAGTPKLVVTPPPQYPEQRARLTALVEPKLRAAFAIRTKIERYAALRAVKAELGSLTADWADEDKPLVGGLFETIKHDFVRDLYLKEHARIDGRAFNAVRPITVETGVLPRVHGSAVFTRGETQSLVSVTLGMVSDGQRIDDIMGDREKLFMLHYNFPPYSVGETKRVGTPGRRELGHGMLAERALSKMVPVNTEAFPYAVRIISEILESNGSSSMASVCGGCAALMDAGVPIKKPVAGIAMGLIEGTDEQIILSDILGDEDHLGDMDFKVCGTADGITAIQMDLKVRGIGRDILTRALDQAKEGRLHILGRMLDHLPTARDDYSPFAPRVTMIKIPVDRIRDVIGSGGKTIREIIDQTGCQIDVEDDGTIRIGAVDAGSCAKAVTIIKGLTEEAEVGKVYTGKVKRLADFGAFVEIIPGMEGLLHISEIAHRRIAKVEDVLHLGDVVEVKLLDVERGGKMRLSMKALLPLPEGQVAEEGGEARERRPRDGDRDGGRGRPRR